MLLLCRVQMSEFVRSVASGRESVEYAAFLDNLTMITGPPRLS